MTLLAPPRRAPGGQPPTEVLIEEARQRQRHRRRALLLAAVLLAGACALLVTSGGTPRAAGGLRHVAGAPAFTVADVTAMRGHGELAFVSGGDLFVIDGANGKITNASGPGHQASAPKFSPDGKWLLFAEGAGSAAFVARADGSHARRLPGAARWLPDSELVTTGGNGASTTYALSHTGGLVRRGGSVAAAEFAAAGSDRYLFVEDSLRVDPPRAAAGVVTIETAATASGPRTAWFRGAQHFDVGGGLQGTFVSVVAELPSGALLLRIHHFCCDYADGGELYELQSPGGTPRPLAPALGAVTPTFGPAATFAFAGGGDRYAWVGKHVELCDAATAACEVLRTPAGSLSLSPAWSPDRTTLAFVEARAEPAGMIGQAQVSSWYATHELDLLAAGASRPTAVAGTSGAAQPVWSSDSKSLLFVRDDKLFLIARVGEPPVEVAGSLFSAGAWSAYYGEVDWGAEFAWSGS